MLGAGQLIVGSVLLALLAAVVIYCQVRSVLAGEELYVAVGSALLFTGVIGFAACSLANRHYSYGHCEVKDYTVLHYEPRYSSAYGKLTKGQVRANHWLLTVQIDGEECTFTLRKEITVDPVTNSVMLQFCKGIFNTKYLKEK